MARKIASIQGMFRPCGQSYALRSPFRHENRQRQTCVFHRDVWRERRFGGRIGCALPFPFFTDYG